jgi:hypothetical protein
MELQNKRIEIVVNEDCGYAISQLIMKDCCKGVKDGK